MSTCPRVAPLDLRSGDVPSVQMKKLTTLWFQVGGTICNLRCNHCFISCSPENDKFKFVSLKRCKRFLDESQTLGVREYYFTGGEPFAHPQMCDILELTLRLGPATVLTNATLFREPTLDRLEDMRRSYCHVLEIRVSLDGYSAEMNDPIRGEGTFDRAIEGVRKLVERGFRPIMTITRTWEGPDDVVLASFMKLLGDVGYDHPRLKILPLIKLGAEAQRGGEYGEEARVTKAMMESYDQNRLVCSSARLVTDRGVWVCPILLDSPEARMGDTLWETMRDYPLRHKACYTCWQYGAICSNVSTGSDGDCCSSSGSPQGKQQ